MAKIDTDKVIKSFGNGWVVTEYGIENQNTYYPIESKRLWGGGDGPGGREAQMD